MPCLSHCIPLRSKNAQSRENFTILSFNSKVSYEWQFSKSGDRYGFFPTIEHIFFWVSEEKEELSPSQILYRFCLSGGELAPSAGLTRLGEISPSLRNSCKNIMCSYGKWARPPRWDIAWFCRDPLQARWKCSISTRASGSAR